MTRCATNYVEDRLLDAIDRQRAPSQANLPPCPFKAASEALSTLEAQKGTERAAAHVERWLRSRKPRKAKRHSPKVVVFKKAAAVFGGGSRP